MSFTVGEEVIYRGLRYVITTVAPSPPYRFRLVTTTADGPAVVWATLDELAKIDSYTRAVYDTDS